MKLHLGVIEQQYADSKDGTTTGDVAEILEAKYGVMDGFVQLHINDIASHLENSLAGSLENLIMGAPVGGDVFGKAMSDVGQDFRNYLDNEEITQIGNGTIGIGGVPTKAALEGKSKRFKRFRGPRRPSFIDSGLFQNSFISWIEP